MADLEQVEQRILQLKGQISRAREQVAQLEKVAEILRSLDRSTGQEQLGLFENAVDEIYSKRVEDLTMQEAAERVLRSFEGGPMHYKEITNIALQEGFRGRRSKPDSPLDTTQNSFRRLMGQRKDIFEPVGEGFYQLRDFTRDNQESDESKCETE